MRMMMRMGAAFGALVATMAMVAAVIAFVVFVVVSLAAMVGVVGAVVAYIKRETWTKPAYHWARDKSGRWSRTPWGPGDGSDPAIQADRVMN